MFRRVREAAKRGRTQAKSLLVRAGHGCIIGAVYVGRAIKKLWQGIDAVLMAAARGVTWTWMSVVEVYSITQSPFTWAIGNVLWFVLRGFETVVNKVRKTEYEYMHRNFSAFTLLNAVAINNTGLYPLIALVGWILSPLSDQNWWRNLAHGYKVRTVSAADFDYVDRIKRDLAFEKTMGEPAQSAWEAATDYVGDNSEPTTDAATYYQQMLADGYSLIYPEAGKEEGLFDYLVDRIANDPGTDDEDSAYFLLTIQEDAWGRHWAQVPDGISTQRPTKAETTVEAEETHPKHAAEPDVIQTDEHGLMNYDITQPPDDYTQLHDSKERSFWFGVEFANQSRKRIKDFLTNEEQQNRARAMVAKDTSNPQTGFLMPYALKGFEQELERAKAAASHQV